MGWLDGKRALVVGAGSGIGRAVVTDVLPGGRARRGARTVDADKAAQLAARAARTAWSAAVTPRRWPTPAPPWRRPPARSAASTCW